jgi:hypothetical protein
MGLVSQSVSSRLGKNGVPAQDVGRNHHGISSERPVSGVRRVLDRWRMDRSAVSSDPLITAETNSETDHLVAASRMSWKLDRNG